MGKLVSVDKLEIGMILGKDVIDIKTGTVLIPENTSITKAFIEKLNNNRVSFVAIKDEEIKAEDISEEIRNEGITQEYSKIENRLDNIFHEIKKGKKLESDKITAEMNSFVKEISLERDILTQMRLLRKTDDYTFNHSLGVSILAITLGKWMGYSEDKVMELSVVGLFHDIGKLKISEEILKKPGALTQDEYEEMKRHPIYSYEMLLETNKFSDDILQGILQHHEKINGTGYPHGRKGDEIHEYAKIIAICDIYHAITSNRIYKDKDSPLRAADYLREESFNSLDANITQIFLKNISKFYVGNKVLLSDGSTGIIVFIHPQNRTKPIVQVKDKFVDFIQPQDIEIIDIVI